MRCWKVQYNVCIGVGETIVEKDKDSTAAVEWTKQEGKDGEEPCRIM